MSKYYKPLQLGITIAISLVWLLNGLFCKILDFVPRHKMIVATMLGSNYASFLTKAIGAGEVLVFVWIVSGIKSRYCAIFQMVMVATMNIMEFMFVPQLLLFVSFNIVFAFLFIVIIYVNEFFLKESIVRVSDK